MSELSGFIADQPDDVGIRLPAHEFAAIMSGYLAGDWPVGQVYSVINAYLSEYSESLTATGEAEIVNMKTHFDSLNVNGKQTYFAKLQSYAILLQEGHMTEAQWDGFLNV